MFFYGFNLAYGIQENFHNFVRAPLVTLLTVRAIAETNRTPFDFAEGESELVSGFNTEYRAGLFAIIFIAEYGIIIFFRYFIASLATSGPLISGQFLIFFWIWLRATLPRYRYDILLSLA